MAGINTYIKEYGDKTFNEEKFNEINERMHKRKI